MDYNLKLSSLDYSQIANKVAELNKQEGVSATISAQDGSNVATITITVNGNTQQMVVSTAPDIDAPEGGGTNLEAAAQLNKLTETLNKIVNELSNPKNLNGPSDPNGAPNGGGSSGGNTAIGSALSDVYAMITLLLKMQQEQKKTAMLNRASDHVQIKAQMTQQAKDMVSAAETTYQASKNASIVGLVGAGTAVLSAAAGGVLQYRAIKADVGGMNAACNNLQTAKADLNSVMNTKLDNNVMPKQLSGALDSLVQKPVVPENVKPGDNGVKNVQEGGAFKDQLTVEIAVNDAKDAKTTVDNHKSEISKMENRITEIDGQLNGDSDREEVKMPEEQRNALISERAEVNRKLETEKKNLRGAQVNLADKLVKVRDAMKNSPASGKAGTPQNKAMNEFLGSPEVKMAMAEGLSIKVENLRGEYVSASQATMGSRGMKQGDMLVTMGNSINAVFSNASGLARAESERKQMEAQAKSKLKDAELEELRAKLDQDKEAVATCREMISMLNQTKRDIEHAQSQSIQTMLRG